MKTRITIFGLALALLATPVLAQEPPVPEEEFDLLGAVKRVAELLTESEALLVKTLAPKKETTPEEAAKAAEGAREAIDDLLQRSQSSGKEVVEKITEILENAPRGKGQSQGSDKSDPSEKDDAKRKRGEKGVDDRDPQNSATGDPTGQKSKKKKGDGNKPPQKKGKPRRPDPAAEWLASLPEQVRQAVQNKDWGSIPARWRDHIKAYMKRVNEAESGSGD
ncbi:MAG: hypothetical protein ACYS99_03400 [Planctomycetota bacterium]|jgi:hypothetical protein